MNQPRGRRFSNADGWDLRLDIRLNSVPALINLPETYLFKNLKVEGGSGLNYVILLTGGWVLITIDSALRRGRGQYCNYEQFYGKFQFKCGKGMLMRICAGTWVKVETEMSVALMA